MNPTDNLVMRPDMRIVAVLGFLSQKYGRAYCYPSQETIADLLKRFHGYVISRRNLNRHLNALEAAGYIHRTKRHQRARDGSLILKSTLYELKAAAWTLLDTLGRIASKLSTIIVHKFNHFAVPKTAQNARHVYLIMKREREKHRSRFKW